MYAPYVYYTPLPISRGQLALQLGNSRCYEIVENSATPPALPRASTAASFNRQGGSPSVYINE